MENARKPDRAFIFFLIGFYAVWVVRVFLLPIDNSFSHAWARQCWSQGVRILVWIVPVLIYLVRVERTNPFAWLKLNVLPRGNKLTSGMSIIFGFLTVVTVFGVMFQHGKLSNFSHASFSSVSGLVFGMVFVAVAEEILFRGFIFQHLRRSWSFAGANAATVLLFWMIHWPGWLYMQGFHSGLLTLSVGIVFIAWVLGWLMEVTQSLWPPIILHLLNNVVSGILMG